MSTHVSKSENLTQANPESFSDKINPSSVNQQSGYQIWYTASVAERRDVTFAEKFVIGIINSYGKSSGECYVSAAEINRKYGISPIQLSKHVSSLKKKGLVYGTQTSLILKDKNGKSIKYAGSRKRWTTIDIYTEYVRRRRAEGNFDEAAKAHATFNERSVEVYKQRFIEDHQAFLRQPANIQKNSPTMPLALTPHLALSANSKEVYKYTSNKTKGEGVGASSPFLEKMMIELRQRKFSSQQLKMAEAYIKSDEPKLMGKKNPLPYIVKMLGKGWAKDALAHKQAKIAATKFKEEKVKAQEEIVQRARDKVQEIKQWAKENEDLKITFSGGAWHIHIGGPHGLTWYAVFQEKDALKHLDWIFKQLKRLRRRYHLGN